MQGIALWHFVKRRPENYWLFIIIFGGVLGAGVYVLVEMIPDLGRLRGVFQGFGRRSRIHVLETQILDNPSAENLEELAELQFDQKNYTKARELLNQAISSRSDSPHPFYLRAKSALGMGDFSAAIPDLEYVVGKDPKFDYYRATGLLGDAYARTGDLDKAALYFAPAAQFSTTPETLYNYANFLKLAGRKEGGSGVGAKAGGKEADAAQIYAEGGTALVPQKESTSEAIGVVRCVIARYRQAIGLS